ncbi:MAG: KpsF/GutQ family sugar-phosphate isomerase [Gemmatimonadetes bacterium]|nr:KpsF/GutQ family sugar-phosphate isomerase [Gemmatimonadota bacterium]
MTPDEITARGARVLRMEREALAETETRLGAQFAAAVQLIAASSGRVIVAGVGKSGLIGRKIAATMTSTGTPAMFLHPVESVHGDLGIVSANDVGILISKSGETDELLPLLEQLQRLGVRTIAISGDGGSTLARHADVWLDASVREEACPHDLAPTTSTTVTLALGDALAVALLEVKGFRREDFARLHPGGALGKKLLLKVSDVMLTTELPFLGAGATMLDAVVQLADRRGISVVVDDARRLLGVITTGDFMRVLEKGTDAFAVRVDTVMTRSPKTTVPDELASAAVYRMEQAGIMSMPVLDASRQVVGVVHLHDLMRAGAS